MSETSTRKGAFESVTGADGAVPLLAPRRPKPPGSGRKKGTPNKATLAHRTAVAALKASGKDPITFFSDLLRNESAPLDLRFQAAKELAPYVHPKLASVEARTGGMTHEARLEALQKMDRDDEGDE